MASVSKYRWLYLLVALPEISNLIESGTLPTDTRPRVTEFAIGIVIALLVHHVLKTHRQLVKLTLTDPLTGLGNRRGLEETIAEDCARSLRAHQPLSLMCIDVDNFKQINDREGHGAGDRVLQEISRAILASSRESVDHSYRIGGDEFAVLLPGSSAADAKKQLGRIRQHCASSDARWVSGSLSMSAGIVEYSAPETSDALFQRGDDAMYANKHQARLRQKNLASRTSAVPASAGILAVP